MLLIGKVTFTVLFPAGIIVLIRFCEGLTDLRPQGGGGLEGQKKCWTIFKDLIEQSEMQKTALKNIIPSESYEFLKMLVAIKLLYAREL